MPGRGRCAAGLLGLVVMVLCACSAPSVAARQQPQPLQQSKTTAVSPPATPATPQPSPSARHTSQPRLAPKAPQALPPKGEPVGVRIARPGHVVLEASIEGPIGLPANGILEPSKNQVYWYRNGSWPKPGFPGPAVLVGHITYFGSKGVFWSLSQTQPGDTVRVRYSSGDSVAFKVTAKPQHIDKNHLPVKKIWKATVTPELRLITCDPNTTFANGHFAGNIIVYADKMVSR